jgi:hypothetical protein
MVEEKVGGVEYLWGNIDGEIVFIGKIYMGKLNKGEMIFYSGLRIF